MLRSTSVAFYPTLQSIFCHTAIYQRHLWGNALEQKIPYHRSPPLDGPHLQKAACQPQAGHPMQMPIQCMPVWQYIARCLLQSFAWGTLLQTPTAKGKKLALKRAELLRNPCILGVSPTPSAGSKIRSGCLTPTFSGAEKRAVMLRHPCILGDPQRKARGAKYRSGYQQKGTNSKVADSLLRSRRPEERQK